MTAQEVDYAHKAKRAKNMRFAMYFINTLIFAVVLSIGYSLQAERKLWEINNSIDLLTQQTRELLAENERLKSLLKVKQ